eukprot:TRINITY_DN13972_c0_g1_i1.p1 TRINITY_DN13972_c0_g1~~TRINITY_DN13972_c0_g1_i1.p1  ORF type:complete len:476 (+),score=93.91 TRINITY_DN13972_c0_g1_i1:93-1520(+)
MAAGRELPASTVQALMSGDPMATTQDARGALGAAAPHGTLGTYASTMPPWAAAAQGRAQHSGQRAGSASARLSHGEYFCPPLHRPGAPPQQIERVPLRALVCPGAPQLLVPPFQRRYCWSAQHAEMWWADGAGNAAAEMTPPLGHSGGRIVLAPSAGDDGALAIIDGQQRLTTSLLLCAACAHAARDAAARVPVSAHAELLLRVAREADAAVCRASVPPEVMERAEAAARQRRGSLGEPPEPPGLADCRWLSLVPSLADRADFIQIVLTGTPAVRGSALAHVYTTLRGLADAVIREAGQPQEGAATLHRAVEGALGRVTVIRVKLGSSEGVQQVYQWLEEKAACSVLREHREGARLVVTDLARNLFLCPLLQRTTEEEQERIVRELWLPLERRGPADLGTLLSRFADVHVPKTSPKPAQSGRRGSDGGRPAELAEYYRVAEAIDIIREKHGGSAEDDDALAIRALCDFAESEPSS